MEENWPNFLIVGAMKAGTTSLWEYLRQIPQIYMSPVKEPHFFTTNLISDKDVFFKPIRDEKKYLSLFNKVSNQKSIGEASPFNLSDVEAPKKIADKIPDAKIIIILRNPVERAFSHYLHTFRAGHDLSSFDESIRENYENLDSRKLIKGPYIELGMYHNQIERYFDIFEKKQIKVIFFEEFFKDVKNSINDILRFLEIRERYNIEFQKIHNPYLEPRTKITQDIISSELLNKVVPKIIPLNMRIKILRTIFHKKTEKPKMEKSTKGFLDNIFTEEIKQIEEILKRKSPWT